MKNGSCRLMLFSMLFSVGLVMKLRLNVILMKLKL